MKSKKIAFIFLFLVAFIVRSYLSTLINKGDILAIEEWSRSLYEKGTAGSYFRDGWVYTAPTQPPLMMLLYRSSRYLYEQRFRLSQWHNLVRIPPTFFILWVDKNGPLFFVRLWGILADLLSGLAVYLLVRKFSGEKSAFWAAFFLLFNPLTIFDSSIWGQVDLLSSLLAFSAIFSFILFGKSGKLFSPVIFTAGILLKPTIVVLAPLYLLLALKKFYLSSLKEKKDFKWLVVGTFASFALIIFSFIPFWDKSAPFLKYSESVISRRMLPSAKGISRVATSGFTFYPIFFEIDRTLGSTKVVFFTLDQLSNLLLLVLACLTGYKWLSWNKLTTLKEVSLLAFLGYFLAEGSFLFKTNMAERYFFPAFLFLYLLYYLTNEKRIKLAIILQQIAWFVNLTASFFMNDYSWLSTIFRPASYWGTRLFSLINVSLYFYLSSYFFNKYSIMKSARTEANHRL